jgi:hypothetical protein
MSCFNLRTPLINLVLTVSLLQSSCRYSPTIYVESFRKKGLSDDQVIQKAINAADQGGMIVFQPERVYTVTNTIFVKKFQVLVGNNATLLRSDQSFTTLRSAVEATDSMLHCQTIPKDWVVGDQVQLLTDSTAAHSNSFADLARLPNIITKIDGNSIVLSSQTGASIDGTIRTWPEGTTVRKVYTLLRGDSIAFRSAPFQVRNINFDGNKQHNNLNYYWNVNASIFMRGSGAKIEDCRFFNIPNENIVGQGILITNCQAYNLNGSFVHLSGIDTILQWPQKHSFISGNYVDGVCQIPDSITKHSEGAITTSFNGGFASIIGNRVYNSGESAIGLIEYHIDTADGGKSDLIIMGNLFENCKKIVFGINPVPKNAFPSKNISITNNIFSNCGDNDWSKFDFLESYSGLMIANNNLTDGTVWDLPEKKPGARTVRGKLSRKKTPIH